jgi:hypothetical protein
MTATRGIRHISWKNALAQIALIFVGVMIALGVRSRWQGHDEQRRVSQYLSAIKTELHATVASLDSVVRTDSLSLFSARRMQGLLTSDSTPLPPSDTIAAWLHLLSPRFDPVTASVDQLLQSGDVKFINDASLRRDLIAFASTAHSAREQAAIMERTLHQYSSTTRERSQAHARWKGAWNTPMASHKVSYDVKALRDDAALRAAYQDVVLQQTAHIGLARKVRRRAQVLLATLGEAPVPKKNATPNGAKPQQKPTAPRPGPRKPAKPIQGTPVVIT